jgi:hypothetical protein
VKEIKNQKSIILPCRLNIDSTFMTLLLLGSTCSLISRVTDR